FSATRVSWAGRPPPLASSLAAHVLPLRHPAPLQDSLASSGAIAAIVGPGLGAVFVSTIGWRWIFTVNIPIGLIATALIWGYRENRPDGAAGGAIDFRGALLLTAGVTLLLVGLGTGTRDATPIWPVAALAIAVLGGFAAF